MQKRHKNEGSHNVNTEYPDPAWKCKGRNKEDLGKESGSFAFVAFVDEVSLSFQMPS